MKITHRLILLILITTTLITLANFLLARHQTAALYADSEKILAQTVVRSLRDALVQEVIDGNKLRVTNLLRSLRKHDNPIEFLYVTDNGHTVFAHSFEQGFPRFLMHKQGNHQFSQAGVKLVAKYQTENGIVYEYSEPLIPGLDTTLHIGLNQSHFKEIASENNQNILKASIAITLLALLLAYVWGRRITKPLLEFANQLHRYGAGDSMNFSKLNSSDPDIHYLSSAFQTATEERHQALTALQEREQDLNITLNSIGDAVITTDAQGTVTRMNPVAEQLTGWSHAEARGLPLNTIFPILNASTREPIANPVEKVLATGETIFLSNHTTLIAKDGTEYQIADSAAPIRDDDEHILGMVLVFNDVTEQYQLREAASKSRRDLQAIMDNTPAVIYVKDIDGRFTFINRQFESILQMRREDIAGKTLHDIFPKDIADVMQQNDNDVLATGRALESEETSPHHDGLHTYVSVKFPLFNEKGDIYAVCGISTDITERKKMENEIRSSAQHLRLYREQAPMATIEWNTDFQVIDWNTAAEKMFGYTVDEIKGRDFFDIMLPQSAIVDVRQIWNDLMAQTGGEVSINENLTRDGRIILCEWHNTPLKNESGKVIGAASIVQDITQRKQQEEQLRRSQKMDALGKLTGGVAHDYNNMLGIIQGYTELLKASLQEQPELANYAHEIKRASERGAKLTKKLLSFSRHKTSDAQQLNINTLLQEIQHMLEKSLTARIKLVLTLAEDIWPVWLDSSDLEDAILNISINAMHAMETGGQFTIQTHNESFNETDARMLELTPGDYVQLSLTDTGSGMDRETRERMFDPFFSTKGEKGTGLGLSQVYGFVHGSKGAIIVYSEAGHGTRLALYFPRYHARATHTNDVAVPNIANLNGDETILVVDDEPALLELASTILSKYGYKIICADSAKQALAIIENTPIDLLLSDVIMPEMDGYQLAAIVQKKHPDLKIQLASGFSDGRHVDMVDDTLHQYLLQKPYSTETLLQRVRALLD